MFLRPGTTEQNLCSKPIRKLCWICWIQPFWINLLHSRAIFKANWRRYFKVKWLYYKVGKHYCKVGQLRAIIKWGKNNYKMRQILYYKVGQIYKKVGHSEKSIAPHSFPPICLLGSSTNGSTCLQIGRIYFESRIV